MNKARLIFVAASLVAPTGLSIAACSSGDSIVVPPDAAPDGEADTSAPPPDGGSPDVQVDAPSFDGGLTVENYTDQVAAAMCSALTRCCFGNANVPDGGAVDGGTFNHEQCRGIYETIGFEDSNSGHFAMTAGNVVIDQQAGVDCLQKIDTLACVLTGAAMKEIRSACFKAIKGTVANGQPCRASLECAEGLFCSSTDGTPGDGGVIGTCQPLRGQGDKCSIYETGDLFEDSRASEEACSWRRSGNTNLRCASYDFVADEYRPRDEWTCQPTVANGQGCNTTVWCSDGICDPLTGYLCQSPLEYFNQFACEAFVD
jgi:hypothetical protein